ncbi:MAG: 50S ribosomal protein L19 [Fibrobacterota bacterium]
MSKIIEELEKEGIKHDFSAFTVGDTVKVSERVVEGNKERTQIFQGTVLRKNKSGMNSTFTVRKISNGIGVEKIFPVNSPLITDITVTKNAKVRRSKLYYLRNKAGKKARLKETDIGKKR